MKIIQDLQEMHDKVLELKTGNKISFIPTMGALHLGHLSLIKKAFEENTNAKIIVSIFANPTQFTNKEDFEKYPDTQKEDIKKLKEFIKEEKIKISYLFIPQKNNDFYNNKKYPNLSQYNINTEDIVLSSIFFESEGKTRKGHFEGVFQVLFRLFNIIKPDYAVFGQKDFQQTLLVKYLQKKYFKHITIIIADIYREKSGLAMSSRNQRLSIENKNKAKIIYKALQIGKNTQTNISLDIRKKIEQILLSEKLVEKINYIEIRKFENFELIDFLEKETRYIILVSLQFSGLHLIDNICVDF